MKNLSNIITSWAVFFSLVIFVIYFSSIENLGTRYNYSLEFERVTFFVIFGIMTVFCFRNLILTFKFTVDKLSQSKSKREDKEDDEFRLIIETLLLIISILINTIVVLIAHQILKATPGRAGDVYGILISVFGTFVFAFFTYIRQLKFSRKQSGMLY